MTTGERIAEAMHEWVQARAVARSCDVLLLPDREYQREMARRIDEALEAATVHLGGPCDYSKKVEAVWDLRDKAVARAVVAEAALAEADRRLSEMSPVADIPEPLCTLREYKAMRERAERAEGERDEARRKIAALDSFHRASSYRGRSCLQEHGECGFCSILDCRWDEPLHYHHDTCPAEYTVERERDDARAEAKRLRGELTAHKAALKDAPDHSDMDAATSFANMLKSENAVLRAQVDDLAKHIPDGTPLQSDNYTRGETAGVQQAERHWKPKVEGLRTQVGVLREVLRAYVQYFNLHQHSPRLEILTVDAEKALTSTSESSMWADEKTQAEIDRVANVSLATSESGEGE